MGRLWVTRVWLEVALCKLLHSFVVSGKPESDTDLRVSVQVAMSFHCTHFVMNCSGGCIVCFFGYFFFQSYFQFPKSQEHHLLARD